MLQRSQTEASTLLSETFEALVTATQQAKDLEDTKAVTARMAELKRQYGLNRKMTKQVKKGNVRLDKHAGARTRGYR